MSLKMMFPGALCMLLGVMLCGAELSPGMQEKLPFLVTGQIQEKGTFILPEKIMDGDEVTIRMKFRERGRLDAYCGTGRLQWMYQGIDFSRVTFWEDVKKASVSSSPVYLRGILRDSFTMNEDIQNWSKFYQYSQPEITQREQNFTIKGIGGEYEFYVHGYYAGRLPANEIKFNFLNMDMISISRTKNPAPERFVTVDISPRYNMNVPFAKDTFPEGKISEFEGIPFYFAPREKTGNVLDLGHSWNRFSNIRSEGNEFGGRWGIEWNNYVASQNNPTRFQFRVPGHDYDALYVLAASIKTTPQNIDTFTVQFYRPGGGFPKNFKSEPVPFMNVKAEGKHVTIDGKNLYLIRVPLDAGLLKEFRDLPHMEFELTKNVYNYQCYPDPFYYSQLGGGLPSAVKVFAMTLEKSPLSVSFEPGATANVFLAPEAVFYNTKFENKTSKAMNLNMELTTLSWDKKESHSIRKKISLKPGESISERLNLKLKKYGHHELTLAIGGDAEFTQKRTLSYLHPRENTNPSFDDPGFMFGVWNWRGGHYTLYGPEFFELIGKTGIKATAFNVPDPDMEKEMYEMAEKWNIRTYFAGDMFLSTDYTQGMEKIKVRDANKWTAYLKKNNLPPDTPRTENKLEKRMFFAFGVEPSLGIYSYGTLPESYGEPPLDPYKNNSEPVLGAKLNANEADKAAILRDGLKKSIPLMRKEYPHYKIMLPWGDPNYAIPFMMVPELAKEIDGVLYDTGSFDRMPETQMHQTVIHRIWQFKQNWKKYSDREPLLSSIEGPCYSAVLPGALTDHELATYVPRSMLILGAYGMNRQFSLILSSAPANTWGEQHYGAGSIGRYATLNPYILHSSASTMIRHMEPLRFVRSVILNTKNIYAIQFENTRNPTEKVYFFWTIRGTRPMKIESNFTAYDMMDNIIETKDNTLVISDSPVIVYGLDDDAEKIITFGDPDHSDSKNGEFVNKIANPDTWKQIQEDDHDYTQAQVNFVRRFPAEMLTASVKVPAEYGSKALSVTLPKQEKNRVLMPHYTTFTPQKPVLIPGTADSLNIHVKGTGDWGRILFVLSDAKGEKWISCGVKNEWNCDDTKNLSVMNFEGWRLMKIPLPGNLPWDSFRLSGTAFWAAYNGDERVDYPLKVEKMIVERREQFLQVNSLEPLEPEAVLIGDIYAEYSSSAAMTLQATLTANLRMPQQTKKFKEMDTYSDLVKLADNSLERPVIEKLEEPNTYNDGSNGFFHFKEIAEAVEYDVYVSRNADGSGAIKLGRAIKKFPAHIRGFKAELELYAFTVYRTKERKTSPPSEIFKFRMGKNFGNL